MAIYRILLSRGDLANVPLLARGEPAIALDAGQLFVGDGFVNVPIGGARVADGDYVQIVVSDNGETWTIKDGVITAAKLADFTTKTLLGRAAAGAGPPAALSLTQVLDFAGANPGAILYRSPGTGLWAVLTNAGTTAGDLLSYVAGEPAWVRRGRMIVADQKTAGTQGGTATSGSWFVRALNTVISDTLGGMTLSANVVTGPTGRYVIRGRAGAFNVNSHQIRLSRATGTVYVAGSSECVQVGATTFSEAQIEIDFRPAAFSVRIEHRVQTTVATFGLGVACNLGEPEIYATLEIERID